MKSGLWPGYGNNKCRACGRPTSEFVHQKCGDLMKEKTGRKDTDAKRNRKRYEKGVVPPFCYD